MNKESNQQLTDNLNVLDITPFATHDTTTQMMCPRSTFH